MQRKLKILFFDIETLPNMRMALKHWTRLSGYYDRTFSASVQSIACATIKQLGKKPKTYHAWDYKQKHKNDDKKLCLTLAKELSEADVIVTHNGIVFDIPFLQTRLALNKLAPLPNITHVDTLKVARNKYNFISNRLGDLAEFLNLKYKKRKHDGWVLWEDLWEGEIKAKKAMSIYNRYDVLVLEEIFKIFRPNIKNLPSAHRACPHCNSLHLIRWGTYARRKRVFWRYRCAKCASFSLSAQHLLAPITAL